MPSTLATSVERRVRSLRRRPDLDRAVLERGGAVLRLERRVRDERIGVERLRPSCASASAASTSPVLRSDSGPACLASFCASSTALLQLSFEALDSSHVTLSLRRALNRRPGRRRENGDARHDLGRLAGAFDDERVGHAGQLLDLVEIRLADLAADGRALLEHGVLHARHDLVDAEQRLAGDDQAVVDAGDALAEQLVVLAVLQLAATSRRAPAAPRPCVASSP